MSELLCSGYSLLSRHAGVVISRQEMIGLTKTSETQNIKGLVKIGSFF